MFEKPDIRPVDSILLENLRLPPFQRPYKWDVKNVSVLLDDIEFAIKQAEEYADIKYKYRVGTVILYKDENNKVNIVDGQQRIVTLALICKALGAFTNMMPPILEEEITSKLSEENIIRNFSVIRTYFAGKKDADKEKYKKAMSCILEFVVVSTNNLAEAFQLFDSQNNRGRPLDPHDLLKAFHLREMRDNPSEMEHAVEKWEKTEPENIRLLFSDYLFPIRHWVEKEKGHKFTAADIDEFKGVGPEHKNYFYAKRTERGMPIFQIDQIFVSGKYFFEYVDYYLNLLSIVKSIEKKKEELGLFLDGEGVGFSYAKQLFFCAVLYYCDRFKNFDDQIVKRLYAWAFMVRLQMQALGFDTVRNYAIGEKIGGKETVSMFHLLQKCMKESDVLKIAIPSLKKEEMRYSNKNDKKMLFDSIQKILGWPGGADDGE